MYETIIMLKPEATFTVDELQTVVERVAQTGKRSVVQRKGSTVRVTQGKAILDICWNNSAHVLTESNEIAKRFGIPSQGCRGRFEMRADDPDMDLFNDYLIINEHLEETGKFVIFDIHERKLLFD